MTDNSITTISEIEHKIKQAAELTDNKQFTSAAELLDSIDATTPITTEMHYNVGLLYGKCLIENIAVKEMWDDQTDCELLFEAAVAHYKKAIDISSDFVGAYNNLARIYAVMGHTDEAREYFQQSLEIDSQQKDALEDLKNLD